MSSELQQALTELQQQFDKGVTAKAEVSHRLAKLKLELAQSGLYFAPPTADQQDLTAARSILEIGTFHSLRTENLKSYWQYNSALLPFYENLSHVLSPSPNRPVILGLYLLALLSSGRLTDFHTVLETLNAELLNDVFIRLPVDLDRWLMEGAYNKVYRARDRVPREEFAFLLDNLMTTVRSQIAATIESSYPSLPIHNAISMLFFKQGETTQLLKFAEEHGWDVSPNTQTITFPRSKNREIALAAQTPSGADATPGAIEILQGKGVSRGVPMVTMVGPALKLASQLEAIV